MSGVFTDFLEKPDLVSEKNSAKVCELPEISLLANRIATRLEEIASNFASFATAIATKMSSRDYFLGAKTKTKVRNREDPDFLLRKVTCVTRKVDDSFAKKILS